MAVALVTGGAGGLGRAVVDRLQRSGTQCAAVSRSAQRLAGSAAAASIVADVSTADGAQSAVEQCRSSLGLPTVMVHCRCSIILERGFRRM
ncbi:MAG: SDR family NAD(P)-dependent oxidoreductase [Betaproteobacteria bacterium]